MKIIKFKKLTFFIGLFFGVNCLTSAQKVINALDYGLNEESDATTAINKAILACKFQKAGKLIIPKGIYHFYPDKATGEYLYIANNDEGLKRIAFPIRDFQNFEIDGQGSVFIMHGQMIAFDFKQSKKIKLKNLSVDWDKPFYFQGTVISNDPMTNSFVFKPFEECSYEIVADELIFLEKPGKAVRPWKDWAPSMKKDIGWQQNIDWNIWFDPKTLAPSLNGQEYVLQSWNENLKRRYRAEKTQDGNIRIFDAAQKLPPVGWVLIVNGRKDLTRTSPAIHLSHVTEFNIENVNVYCAGGMGLITESSKDINLKKFNVVLPENSSRMVTTTADATHFVGCRGNIVIDDCQFENMLDDATNVHGIYGRIDGLVNKHTIGVKRIHGQQLGFSLTEVGDIISLSDAGTLKEYARLKVTKINDINSEYMEIICKEDLDKILKPNSVINNLSCQPNLVFKNSLVRRNRARSMLISTSGNVLVENNLLESCTHTSILFAGDAIFWYESGPVKNVIIRNNTFKNFGLHGGTSPLIQIAPEIVTIKDFYFHSNILVENNICEVFSCPLVVAKSVEKFQFVGNKIRNSTDYPLKQKCGEVFRFTNSKEVLIKNNKAKEDWIGFQLNGMKSMLEYFVK
jgi:hypothetical protein